MDAKLANVEKKVLVELVKLAQKRGFKGPQGGWKDFLNIHDRKFGSSMSDPSKRSNDVLISFLKTFTEDDVLKIFDRVLQCHINRQIVEQFSKECPDNESPEQKLVRLTLGNPIYTVDYTFPSHEEGWVVTKLPKKSKVMKSNEMIAVDCEMVLCQDGTEALVRLCAVDRNLEVKLDKLVKPNKTVSDYRTEITGVAPEELDGVTCSLEDIQIPMKKLLANGTILVGHSLNNDLKALKLDHARVIDTSYIFKVQDGPSNGRPSLNSLCKSVLGYEVRKQGAAHNCLDDARAAMKLVLSQLKHGGDIPIACEEVSQAETAKLLLHNVPVNIPSEELSRIIPASAKIEVKSTKKGLGEKYSALAIFNSPQEACRVFESLDGSEVKDTSGRPQKKVRFQSSTGVAASIYVRKMASDDSQSYILAKKRALDDDEKSNESKKLKVEPKALETQGESKHSDDRAEENGRTMDKMRDKVIVVQPERQKSEQKTVEEISRNSSQSDDLLKEIERLKQELREKDLKIDMQEKTIESLERKVLQMKKGLSNVILEL